MVIISSNRVSITVLKKSDAYFVINCFWGSLYTWAWLLRKFVQKKFIQSGYFSLKWTNLIYSMSEECIFSRIRFFSLSVRRDCKFSFPNSTRYVILFVVLMILFVLLLFFTLTFLFSGCRCANWHCCSAIIFLHCSSSAFVSLHVFTWRVNASRLVNSRLHVSHMCFVACFIWWCSCLNQYFSRDVASFRVSHGYCSIIFISQFSQPPWLLIVSYNGNIEPISLFRLWSNFRFEKFVVELTWTKLTEGVLHDIL